MRADNNATAVKTDQQPKDGGSNRAAMEHLLPLLDRKNHNHGRLSESLRRSYLLEDLEHDHKTGELWKLQHYVQNAKLDTGLCLRSEVKDGARVVSNGTKYCIICENVFFKFEDGLLRPIDMLILKNAVDKLEGLGLGQNLWKKESKTSRFPLMPKVQKELLAYMEPLHLLAKSVLEAKRAQDDLRKQHEKTVKHHRQYRRLEKINRRASEKANSAVTKTMATTKSGTSKLEAAKAILAEKDVVAGSAEQQMRKATKPGKKPLNEEKEFLLRKQQAVTAAASAAAVEAKAALEQQRALREAESTAAASQAASRQATSAKDQAASEKAVAKRAAENAALAEATCCRELLNVLNAHVLNSELEAVIKNWLMDYVISPRQQLLTFFKDDLRLSYEAVPWREEGDKDAICKLIQLEEEVREEARRKVEEEQRRKEVETAKSKAKEEEKRRAEEKAMRKIEVGEYHEEFETGPEKLKEVETAKSKAKEEEKRRAEEKAMKKIEVGEHHEEFETGPEKLKEVETGKSKANEEEKRPIGEEAMRKIEVDEYHDEFEADPRKLEISGEYHEDFEDTGPRKLENSGEYHEDFEDAEPSKLEIGGEYHEGLEVA